MGGILILYTLVGGLHREQHVDACVPIGDRENVQLIHMLLVPLQPDETSLRQLTQLLPITVQPFC
jgi:hypothetical protein